MMWYFLAKIKKMRLFIAFVTLSLSSLVFGSWQEELLEKIDKNAPPLWMLEQIKTDLAPFIKSGISKSTLDNLVRDEHFYNAAYLVRYNIINNNLTIVNPSASLDFRCTRFTETLYQLTKAVKIDDVDFVVTIHDAFPDFYYNEDAIKAPIFAFAKNLITDNRIILIPDWETLQGYEHLMHIVRKGTQSFPWESKIQQAIWRGGTSDGGYLKDAYNKDNFHSYPRSKLVTLSMQYPSIIDARFSELTYANNSYELFPNYFENKISVFDHLAYKYQILIDGSTCSYSRAYWQLLSNCIVFKQESNNIQWYYGALQPYVHYIPVQNDMSDLIDKITWVKTHDSQALEYSKNATKFAEEDLSYSSTMYYLYLVLKEYAKLQEN
jgi:hypothetical protein